MTVLKFDVFGKKMLVRRQDQQWLLFNDSDTGMATPVYDVVIPADLTAAELIVYLDDIYHEYATATNDKIVLISANTQ